MNCLAKWASDKGNKIYYVLKIMLTAGIVVAVSEASKRSSLLGGLLASLPLISFLGLIWLYIDTGSTEKVADLSKSVFWLVLPSLALFLILPPLLRAGWNFWAALGASSAVTVILYVLQLWLLPRLGVKLSCSSQ